MPRIHPANNGSPAQFARSLRAQLEERPTPRPERNYLPGALLLCLPTLGCAAVMAFARPQSEPGSVASGGGKATPPAKAEPTGKAVVTVTQKTAEEATPAVEPADAASGRRSLDFYVQGMSASMFSAPQPPPPPAPKPEKKAPTLPTPPIFIAPPNPFADWNYSGVIKAGNQITVLLEHKTTKEGKYLKQGEMFQGAQVTSVSEQMVTLTQGGKPYMLAKSDAINVTPLEKNAPFLSAQPGQPQPGQPQPGAPGMPGGMPPMGNFNMGGSTMILPNGQVLSGDRAARRQRFMNRAFNR